MRGIASVEIQQRLLYRKQYILKREKRRAPWKKMRIENNDNSGSENEDAMQVLEIFKR